MKAEKGASSIVQLEDGIFLIPLRKSGGCNIFVLKGSRRIALIDAGLPDDHDYICSSLAEIGLTIDDVSLVILSHEHHDHVGDLPNLPKNTLIAAHSRAAIKLQLDDQFAMMSGAMGRMDPGRSDARAGAARRLAGRRSRRLGPPPAVARWLRGRRPTRSVGRGRPARGASAPQPRPRSRSPRASRRGRRSGSGRRGRSATAR